MDEIEAVLHLIQHLDPWALPTAAYKSAYSSSYRRCQNNSAARELAIELINNHLPLLGTRDFATLTRKLKVQESSLSDAIELIKS